MPENGGNAATHQAESSPVDATPGKPVAPRAGDPSPAPEPGAQAVAAGVMERHPSDKLIAASRLVSEQWSPADALGNRERTAIYQTDEFKYPKLRVVEKWSGKTGGMVSRLVMVADHLLAGPRAGIDAAALEKRVVELGFTVVDKVGESSVLLSFTKGVDDPAELPRRIDALSVMKDVVGFSEPDYIVWPCIVPNDAAFAGNKLWGLRNLGGVSGYTAGADIDAPAAWDVRNDASGVIVAVTDTGIRHDHQDLAPNMWHNPAEAAGDGIDNDGNGVVDDVYGFDAYNNDGDPMDTQGHGTHCAGTIGARGNNGLGMTGVAWNVQLMAGRFLGPNGGTTSDGIRVIDYSRQKGAHVISASWGGGGFSIALENAIAACANAGIPFVAAAGNSGTDNDSLPHYPSSYDLPNIVAVAATNANDELTGFSCFGRNSVDIAAPGWQIWSSYIGSTTDYRFLQGTSMATPHVSGALALARAQFPSVSVEELIERLYKSADKLASLDNMLSTGGRLNLHRLLTENVPSLPHDQFDTPLVLAGDFATWSGSSRNASREPDEASYSPAAESRTLWFAWRAPFDGFANISTNSLGAGQRLVVFSGNSRETLRIVNDTGVMSANQKESGIHFLAVAGTEYRIVTASNSLSGELFGLTMELVAGNDLLSRAHVIEGESFENPWSNRGATAQPFENAAPHAGVGAGHSVWFRWTAPLSGQFTLNTEGSGTDTVIAVYTGQPANPAGFSTAGSNDDVSATHRWSRVDFNAVAGVSYYIAVDTAMGGVPGPFVLRGAVPAPPVIASEPADLEIPFGGRGLFSVGAVGTPPLRYQWFKNNEAVPGAWQNSLIIDPVTAGSLGAYHVVVSNSFGSITSRTAQLTEKRFAPAIAWSTGDVAILSGQGAALGVRASGSETMTYSWTKDGVPLVSQTQSSLQFASVTAADKGVYICSVGNDRGSAAATMVLTVVTSPFDSFTAVRESAPNSPITNISVIDGKCYAVASERIMVSTDGRAWTPWYLPGGFDGSALAKHDGKWYCSGFRADGKYSMTISLDGVTWQDPVLINGFTLYLSSSHTPTAQLISFNGRLVIAESPRMTSGGMWESAAVYHSTDGTNWTRAKRRKIDSTLVDLSIMCRFEMWGGKIYAPGDGITSSVLVTTDGITWQESALPVDGTGNSYREGKGIGTFGNRLCIVCAGGTYSTSDGVNWTMDGSLYENEAYFGRKVVSTGNQVYAFSTWAGMETYKFGTSTTTWKHFAANPPGRKFSAAVEFDGMIVYGTTTGLLRRIGSQEDFSGIAEAVYPLSRLEFVNDEFIGYRKGYSDTSSPGSVIISGDGRRWRAVKPFVNIPYGSEETNPHAKFFLGGRYYSSTAAGWIPSAMSSGGLPSGVSGGAAAATNGTEWLVATSSSKVYSVSMDGSAWTSRAATGLTVAAAPTLLHFNGKWFLNNGNPTTVYTSANGSDWTTVPNVSASCITLFGGKIYAIHARGTTLYESADGITWQSFSTGITGVGTTDSVGTTTVSATRMLVFDNKLIVLVNESLTRRSFVFFSPDGRTWFRGNAPVTLQDLNVGRNVLVGVTSNGCILNSGTTGAGGAAPLVNITSPSHYSTHVSGTMVEITGTAIDPEGQSVTSECMVNGISIGSSTGTGFRFKFRASNVFGDVITVRSRDAAGLVGSNEIKVFFSAPQLKNDFESEEGKSYLPQVAWASFGGRAYVAGPYALYRTRNDGSWESVLLPSLPGPITNLVAGNGTLLVQTGTATFATRDGVVWIQLVQPSGGTISFRNGWFVSVNMFSQDGLSWTSGLSPNNGGNWSPSVPTVTPGGNLITMSSLSAAFPYRSIDGGSNWIEMPAFGTVNLNTLQFATAFGAVYAGHADGRVFRSADDGRTWQQVAQFQALPTGHYVRIALHAGRLFWGGGGYWRAGSDDGTFWRNMEGEPLQSSQVVRFDGRFVGFGRSGMLWSANGYVWQPAKAGPENPVRDMLADDGDALLMGDTDGGVWRAEDGRTWIKVMPGRPVTKAPAAPFSNNLGTCLQLGSTVIFGGTYNQSNTYLLSSTNGGLDWNSARFHGGSFSGVTISNMWANGSVAFAATSRALPENNTFNGLWRSTDGRDWKQLWTWPGGAVAEMRFEGNEWWCLGANGELRRSSDNGETWSADIRPPGLLAGRMLIRFDGAWIVIGTEAANLQGPNVVNVSTDGQTWTRQAAPGGETAWSRLAYAATANALVVTSSSGKIYTASNRTLNWATNATTLSFLSSGVYQIDVVGGKFCILGRLVSDDGVTWTKPTAISSTTATPMGYFNGLYVAFQYNLPPLWSTDGLNWTQSTGSGTFGYRPVFAVGANALRVRLTSGAIWETTDGKVWTMARDETADMSNTGFARRIFSFGNRLLVTGTSGLLLYSDDDGRSWLPGLVNGQQLPPSTNEREIKTSPTEVIATYHVNTNYNPPVSRHFRSQDGRAWTELPDMAALNVMDYAWAEGAWLAICHNGSLLRSIDGGLTWSNVGIIPGVLRGLRLTRFQGVWVAAGTTTPTGTYPPIQLHTSPDGIEWTNRGDSGSLDQENRNTPPTFFTGHSLLFFGRQPSVNSTAQGPVKCTVDGITWTTFDKTGNAKDSASGTTSTTFIPIADGYLACGSNSSTSFYWKAPVIGGSWTAVSALQNQIKWVGTPDGQRLFLFGSGVIKEWTAADLELTVSDPAPTVIGVGDNLTTAATLRNLGSTVMNQPVKVDAWLSADRFFGDGNDVYVGGDAWIGPVPEPGSAATQTLSFTLPNTVRPGSHYLILELDLPSSYREANRANNVAMTGGTAVTIPQRKLKVKANGNGAVNADQNAEYYPHGARIAMVATPGKGARFAGWGGDAIGSLSETLIIMDADKNVEASFVSTAALTVFTRGGGGVQQSSDDGIYVSGSTANLTAVPLPGWAFDGWSGSLTGNQTADSLLMDSNKIVTARFSLGLGAWKNQKFNAAELADPAVSGDNADVDGDGLQNWREWLRGSDPKNRSSHGQSGLRREGNWLVMTYTRMANMPAGHAVRASASTDLGNWSVPFDERIVGSASGMETIEARVDVTGMPRVFLRTCDTRSVQ